MAKVLIVGSGGREHALAWKIEQSPLVEKVYIAPGNPGTAEIGENVDIDVNDFERLSSFTRENRIELTVVGPEVPLVNGIVDHWNEQHLPGMGSLIFGPDKQAAMLEGSKYYAKTFMQTYGIPTAPFRFYGTTEMLLSEIKEYPIVLKADGLAAGKGSVICNSAEEAKEASEFIQGLGPAGRKIIVEDFLTGEEASILALTDGYNIATLISSQDHKAVFENEEDRARWIASGGDPKYANFKTGPNTGGMGAYAPAPVVTPDVLEKVYKRILIPTIEGMQKNGTPYKGVLYAGLMINEKGDPYVVEFNCRFGDPETQVVLPMLKNDLFELLRASADGHNYSLRDVEIENHPGAACCVIMASGGYPGSYTKGLSIYSLNQAPDDRNFTLFHAGTKKSSENMLTNGGRVLGITGKGSDLRAAIENAYSGVSNIEWEGEYHRNDIGHRAIER